MRRFGPRLLAWAVILAWLAPCAPLRAQAPSAEEGFRRGVEAADRQDWPTVRRAMADALELRAEPGGRPVKIYGMRFEDYVPQYFLGRALEAEGACAEALEAWSTPGLEALLDAERLRRVEEGRARCRARMASEASTVQEPPPSTVQEPPAPEVLGPTEPALGEQPAREEPSPRLRRAAADYLAGRYEAVIAAADPELEASASRSEATARLLRGAARFALHRRTGEVELLAAARADLSAHRRLRPEERPSPYWFSPDFLDFYDRGE